MLDVDLGLASSCIVEEREGKVVPMKGDVNISQELQYQYSSVLLTKLV